MMSVKKSYSRHWIIFGLLTKENDINAVFSVIHIDIFTEFLLSIFTSGCKQ